MGEEQIRLVWKDAAESLFRLRIQAQTEKLASPSEARKLRRTIARCQTILTQRGLLKNGSVHGSVTGDGHDATSPQIEKHAKKHRESGRAKVHATGKAGVAKKREFKKRTQSGT